jgi:C4-dicarboxylate transporter DctM subunit
MAVTIWGSSSSWTLTALPLFVWMGEILFRTRLSQDMFRGLAPWMQLLPGRLLHVNVVGCAIFAAVSGSSAATCATIGKMSLPELKSRGYPDGISDRLAGRRRHAGLLIPPSIIMIVYGVTADVSIAQLFIAGVLPGILLALLFSGYLAVWACATRAGAAADRAMSLGAEAARVAPPDPGRAADRRRAGQHLRRHRHRHRSRRGRRGGRAGHQRGPGLELSWQTFKDSLLGGTRLYCMIALILSGAAFLTLSMGYIGLPRHLAEWIATLGLASWQLLVVLMVFYIVLGCFLDGISMVVLTMGVILPTVQKAGIDPLWFGIFVVLVVEMAQITPPVGFNLFVLQGMTQREIGWIARGRFSPGQPPCRAAG